MKNVKIKSNILFFSLFLILFLASCKRENFINELNNKNISYVDFEKDTVVYKLYVKTNCDIPKKIKNTFLVVCNLYANEINLGTYSEKKNAENSPLYKDKDTINLSKRYYIFIKENGKLIKLWSIENVNVDEIAFPILEQGTTCIEHHNNELKSSYSFDYNILKIKFKTDNYPDFQCLNFKINDNNSWELISKEKLNTTLETKIKGYSINKSNKLLSYSNNKQNNKIIFQEAFDY